MQNILNVQNTTEEVSESVKSSVQSLMARADIGFTKIPSRSALFLDSENMAQELITRFDRVVVIGIGGSSMGGRALLELAGNSIKPLYFLDNVDADQFKKLVTEVASSAEVAAKTGFLVVSKSGSTIEILWNYSMLEAVLKPFSIDMSQQSYFVSDLGENPISKLARENGRPLLAVPSDIGGRFSVLTPVGLVVAKICGFDLEKMRQGAELSLNQLDLVASNAQTFLNSFKRKEDITLFWFYHSRYRWFGAWLQQLWAESLGKMHDLEGKAAPTFSTPMSAIGACDQHSILQQVAHGIKNKFVCFFSFKSATESPWKLSSSCFAETEFAIGRNYGDLIHNQAKATAEALTQNKVSNISFEIDDSDLSKTIGYLFMHFQLVVAVIGIHEKINPFDQPGVALGKQLTMKLLKNSK